jgi:hypothetical protein
LSSFNSETKTNSTSKRECSYGTVNGLKNVINTTFRGVSTKYLQNYLSLIKINKIFRNSISIIDDTLNVVLQPSLSYLDYTNISKYYRNFLKENLKKDFNLFYI